MKDEAAGALTPCQRDVLLEINRLERLEQVVTLTRIGTELKMPRQNARTYVLALRDRGLVLYEAGARQTAVIRLTDRGRAVTCSGTAEPDLLSFPILGEVATGEPTLAEDQIEGYAARFQDVLDLHEGNFSLHVRGDMTAPSET